MDAEELLRRAPIRVDEGPYALVAWPPGAPAPTSARFTVRDDKETTALVREVDLDDLDDLPAPERVERGWAVLTLDLAMEWDVVGVLALVTARLAARGIPVGAVSAFSRDHLLVRTDRVQQALQALAF